LLQDFADPGPFRLVGLAAYEIDVADADPPQLELLPAPGNRARRLETAIDTLVSRFGAGVVQRAGDLGRDRGVGIAANLDFLHDRDREGEGD
jgi:hypothetical protein